MDVHPTKNGINRYWSIAIWCYLAVFTTVPRAFADFAEPPWFERKLAYVAPNGHRAWQSNQTFVLFINRRPQGFPRKVGWCWMTIPKYLRYFSWSMGCLAIWGYIVPEYFKWPGSMWGFGGEFSARSTRMIPEASKWTESCLVSYL